MTRLGQKVILQRSPLIHQTLSLPEIVGDKRIISRLRHNIKLHQIRFVLLVPIQLHMQLDPLKLHVHHRTTATTIFVVVLVIVFFFGFQVRNRRRQTKVINVNVAFVLLRRRSVFLLLLLGCAIIDVDVVILVAVKHLIQLGRNQMTLHHVLNHHLDLLQHLIRIAHSVHIANHVWLDILWQCRRSSINAIIRRQNAFLKVLQQRAIRDTIRVLQQQILFRVVHRTLELHLLMSIREHLLQLGATQHLIIVPRMLLDLVERDALTVVKQHHPRN
mmetsp:Transcript_22735/g.36504  ORF Transcript_22735/g.36504 Transcript_22735/m.36504 type:complete len:274 (+) Transcript_22735:327-1148(+)